MKYIALKDSVIIYAQGEQTTIPATDPRFEEIQKKIKSKSGDEEILRVLNLKKSFENKEISVKDGLIHYKGRPVPAFLGDNFYNFKIQEKPLMGLINFWFNLQNRTSLAEAKDIVKDLIEKDAYSLTDDGFTFVYNSSKTGLIGSEYFFCYASAPKFFRDLFEKKKTFNDLVDLCFKKNTKKLRNILRKESFKDGYFHHKMFGLGLFLKDYVSQENLIELFGLNFPSLTSEEMKGCHLFFDQLTEKKIISLLKKGQLSELKNLGRVLSQDSSKMEIEEVLKQIKNRKFKDFNEIKTFFNELSLYWGKTKVNLGLVKNFPELKDIKEKLKDEAEIKVPETNFDLIRYSYILGHCIGTHGYDKMALEGNKILLAVYQKGKLLYNIDICSKTRKITQFRGQGNKSIFSEKDAQKQKLKRSVLKELKRAKVISEEQE